jgi:murein DD-endopeptidase MepM/ murein hydrolase activator NlpD
VPRPPESADFINPLPGSRVTRSWGSGHLDPFSGKPVFHRGIDVAAKTGTPVLGAADGVVVVATENYETQPSAGTVVIIDHQNGTSTYYGHLASFEVAKGQHVQKGDVIASVGSTGKSTGPHLHFEVRSDGEALDPADFVDDWK